MSFEEWERLLNVPSFARLLMSIPLEAGDTLDRIPGKLRDVDI